MLKLRQGLTAVACGFDGHAGFLQRKADNVANVGVIVDNEDAVRQSVLPLRPPTGAPRLQGRARACHQYTA